jgi:hypothetical protein
MGYHVGMYKENDSKGDIFDTTVLCSHTSRYSLHTRTLNACIRIRGNTFIMWVFRVLSLCSLVDGAIDFGGTCCVHNTFTAPLNGQHQYHCLHLPV